VFFFVNFVVNNILNTKNTKFLATPIFNSQGSQRIFQSLRLRNKSATNGLRLKGENDISVLCVTYCYWCGCWLFSYELFFCEWRVELKLPTKLA